MIKPAWTSMFEIAKEVTTFTLENGVVFSKMSYFVVCKATGEKIFHKTRNYGYSDIQSAKGSATRHYKAYLTAEEKMLGDS